VTFTYPEVGATEAGSRGGPLPGGYHHLRHRTFLGRAPLPIVADAILSWRMHRATGARVTASGPRAVPGVRVSVGLGVGPLRVTGPCEVVWAVEEEARAGFGYGTLPGHPERGEESFTVERGTDGGLWFTVTAFSVPARWYTRAGGPVVVLFQHAYARRLGAVLRRLCGSGPGSAAGGAAPSGTPR
jgi:uncharacterized protein (UPF0548 family)